MNDSPRVAAITPYYNETEHLLRRCIDSVSSQNVKTDHFLISDGLRQDWLDDVVTRHVKLGKSHRDYGNTPRGLGALLAVSEGYDAVFFLDADNWIEPIHVQKCLQSAATAFGSLAQCDCVIAKRLFKRLDETTMPISEEHDHVDTNCYSFLQGSFHLLSIWVTLPKYLSSLGDRFFYSVLKSKTLNVATTDLPTVNYHCTYSSLYRAIGETPPQGTKENISDDYSAVVKNLSERELEILYRLTGGLRFQV